MGSKIKSGEYGKLSGYSSSVMSQETGPFTSVFISGEQRDDQDIRKMHCIRNGMWESKDIEEKYIFRNKTQVNFIIMFLKKIRLAETSVNGRNTITYFSWNPDQDEYPPNAKCQYIFGGALLDENFKPIHSKEEPTRAELIYFRNKGTKVGNAVQYLSKLSEASQDLEDLSDDPEFEQMVVTPRRFITQVTIGSVKTDYGNKDVFVYTPIKQLPDTTVIGTDDKEGIMQRCMNWVDAFDQQFNLEKRVSNNSNTHSSKPDDSQVTFDDSNENTESNDADDTIDDLDLGI